MVSERRTVLTYDDVKYDAIALVYSNVLKQVHQPLPLIVQIGTVCYYALFVFCFQRTFFTYSYHSHHINRLLDGL